MSCLSPCYLSTRTSIELFYIIVTRNITRDFASIDGDVLQMALEAGEYNEEMIRGMLESLTE